MKCEKLKDINYVVFSGGAVRGIALTSAFCTVAETYFKYIEREKASELLNFSSCDLESNFIKKLKGAGGTSIGAAIALIIVCGASLEELESISKDESFHSMDSVMKTLSLQMGFENGGFLTHQALFEKIDRLLNILNLPIDINFCSLYQKTGKLFICNASNYSTKETFYMSYKTTPYLKIRDALCMSMCLPIFFLEFKYQGYSYYDGGIYCNYIINQFPENETLGFKIEDGEGTRAPSFSDSYENGIEKVTSLFTNLCERIDKVNFIHLSQKQKEFTLMVYTPDFKQIKIFTTTKDCMLLWEYGKLSAFWHLFRDIFIFYMIEHNIEKQMKKISHETLK